MRGRASRCFLSDGGFDMAKIARGLPTPIAASLGRIIARWAYQEILLTLIVKNSANVDIKTARIALREPKLDELASFLSDILSIRGLKPRQDIATLAKKLKAAKE